MKSFLVTWNPAKWPWEDLARMANETLLGQVVQDRWSCVTKQITPEDRCFLMMLGSEKRGIIASGWATSKPFLAKHWDAARAANGDQCQFVSCEWERLINPQTDSPLPVTTLERELGRFDFHWTPQSSGICVPDDLADELEKLWSAHVGGSTLGNVDADPEVSAFEGEQRIAIIRHRRREQKLRAAKLKEAINAGGGRLRCEVPGCGFDFFEIYGEVGFEFAHVHHLNPLADRETPTATRLTDLAIVCANCHAMIHRGGKCRPLQGLVKG